MNYAEQTIIISEVLSISKQVTSLDSEKEKEASTLAHCFLDLQESFNKFNNELLPKINQNLNEEEIDDLLLDIGEEFRHILYHIKDSKFYNYLQE